MSQSIKQTALFNTYKILSGRTTIVAAPGETDSLDMTIPQFTGKPILFKIFFTIDSRPELYVTPVLNTALSNLNVATFAYMGNNGLNFEVDNFDTVSHTLNVTYFIYADKFS